MADRGDAGGGAGRAARFLAGDEVDLLDPDVVSFRKLSRTTAGRRDAALAAGRIAVEIADWMEARFRLPAPDLPTLEKHEPETAAEIVRQRWDLGERPVANVVHLLERTASGSSRSPRTAARWTPSR